MAADRSARKRAKPARRRPKAATASFYLEAVGGSLGTAPISLEAIVEASSDAILFIDRERRIRFWSRGASETFGYTREEATGQYYDLLVPADLRAAGELDDLERATEAQGTVRDHLTRRVTKDGRVRHIALSRTALMDERGQVVG
ncbi:MAG TPA: PAS domain-containing protein, partial [Planctomycetota bacterium]|nr:PAS domain-containing protein [Planctomycetota bacterium]